MSDIDDLAAWWGQYRNRAMKALAISLGIDRVELLRRLGATEESALRIVPSPPPKPIQQSRGRPRRQDGDRADIVRALAMAEGSMRGAANRLGIPRMTLTRMVERQRIPEWAHSYGQTVAERHARLLHESGVSPVVASARGYRSLPASLRVPIWPTHGDAWTQTRLDNPSRQRCRYKNGRGARAVVDMHPSVRDAVLAGSGPLVITESPRKADAAISRGFLCVSVPGVRLIPWDMMTWEIVGVSGRPILIAFDADVRSNPEVSTAEQRLADLLRGMRAEVLLARIPPVCGPKTGLDDYLSAGGRIEDLWRPISPQ